MSSNSASKSGSCSLDDLENDPVILVSRKSSRGLKTVLEESSPAVITHDESGSIPATDLGNIDDEFEFGMRCEAATQRDSSTCDRCFFSWEKPAGSPDEFDNASVVFEEIDTKSNKGPEANGDAKKGSELPKPQVVNGEATDSKADDTKLVTKKNSKSYAVILHNGRENPASNQTAHLHSVIVQSPLIKKVLRNTFGELHHNYMDDDYRGVRLTFPFDPILLCWDKLQDVAVHDPSKEVREHVKLLLDAVRPTLKLPLEAIQICHRYGAIAYQFLWAVYQPGELMYLPSDGFLFEPDQLARITECRYRDYKGGSRFEISSESIEWSGVGFGLVSVNRVIERFQGTCDISSFDEIPLQFHPDKANIKERLLERGRKYEKLRGFHIKSYSGPILEEQTDREYINERVVIDDKLKLHLKGQRAGVVKPLIMKNGRSNHISDFGWSRPQPALGCDPEDAVVAYDSKPSNYKNLAEESQGSLKMLHEKKPLHKDIVMPLTEEQQLICLGDVEACLINQKRWGHLQVDKIKDIEWDDTFDELVLPKGEKNLILAFVEEHIKSKAKCGGLVQGKGKSLVILIKGPPGVGKSLTAESMAEKLHLPLLKVNYHQRNRFWDSIPEFNNAWNAILLLKYRNLKVTEDQELLNEFLEKLDAYQGILFITTDHPDTLDPALSSRIDLTIEIQPPAYPERCQLWTNAFARERRGRLAFTEREVHLLADEELNGRQIVSVMKMAKLLAGRRGEEVGVSHALEILRLRER